jgi:NAD(P)-dependent dehydrogenase (short-subunit alcohol dehydrogenase family)
MSEVEGKLCVVTGSNSGIGKETTLSLAQKKAKVVIVVRNLERGKKAREEIVSKSGNNSIDLMGCDLSSMESIRRFVQEFKAKYDKLDVLINNAGAVFYKRQITVDGFERTLAVDYLAPFLLTHELLSILKSSAPSRIINISSGFYKSGKIDFDDLQSEKEYKGMRAYANAKLMILMFTYELARLLDGYGVTANAVLPGFVATNLGRNSGSRRQSLLFRLMRPFQISAQQAARTLVYLATSKQVEGLTGKCFTKMKEVDTSQASHDLQTQKILWDTTAKLLGITELLNHKK